MCASSPTPRVIWRRVNQFDPTQAMSLPTNRYQIDDFGMTLSFTNLQQEDAGRYECRGYSTQYPTPKLEPFTLYIEGTFPLFRLSYFSFLPIAPPKIIATIGILSKLQNISIS